MPKLSYCPNCKCDLDFLALSWICRQTFVKGRVSGRLAGASVAELPTLEAPPTTQAQVHGNALREICLAYNKHSPESASCHGCGKPRASNSFSYACPECEREIPDLANCNAEAITVCGAAASGKTHYIVALEYWCEQHVSRFGWDIMPAMPDDLSQLFQSFRSQVQNEMGPQPLRTNSKGEMFSFYWQLTANLQNLSDEAEHDNLLLCLPDVSGEDMYTRNSLARTRLFHGCSGIIMLLDGERIARALGCGHDYDRNPGDHMLVIRAMIQDLRDRLKSRDELAELPIAVCVNKVDILANFDARWNRLMAEYPSCDRGMFDFDSCAKRSEAIKALLSESPSTVGIVNLLTGTFANAVFFPMMTLGRRDQSGKHVFGPQGVGDPLVWLLYFMHHIR